MTNKTDIYEHEVPNLINKLIRFLGINEIKRCLHKYNQSLNTSGPLFREYYLKTRHPWWNALLEYFELEKAGKSIRKNLSTQIKLLAGDAKKISTLQRFMPESVKNKYKKDLLDENPYGYLFEILVAWHFYVKTCNIDWYEDSAGKHSEFLVKTHDFEFNVECKRISVDASRMIRRKDFYRLAERLIPQVQEKGYLGTIDIFLRERLHSNDNFLNEITSHILNEIIDANFKGNYQTPYGSISIKLEKAKGEPIDFNVRFMNLKERMPNQAHGAIFAKDVQSQPADPIELTIVSEKADNILDGIRDRIYRAAKKQLEMSKPAFIACFLEGIHDLTKLASNSGLQIITNILLNKDDLSHVAAISYCAETMIEERENIQTFFNQGLIFRNPNCKFEKAKTFEFLGGEL